MNKIEALVIEVRTIRYYFKALPYRRPLLFSWVTLKESNTNAKTELPLFRYRYVLFCHLKELNLLQPREMTRTIFFVYRFPSLFAGVRLQKYLNVNSKTVNSKSSFTTKARG